MDKSGLERALLEARNQAIRDQHKKRLDDIVKVSSAMFDKASAYANLILAAGYAGYFAVWSNMKALMSPTEMRITAVCILVSLLLFVVWEIWKMATNTQHGYSVAKVLKTPQPEFDAAMAEHQKRHEWRTVQLMKVWPWIFWPTLATALFGAVILVVAFVRGLWDVSPLHL